MQHSSKIEWQLVTGDWWYTFALALSLGVALAGLYLLVRSAEQRKSGGALLLLGVILGSFTATVGLNSSPWNVVEMDVHPYLSHVIAAGMLSLAVLLGVLIGGGAVLLARRTRLPASLQVVAAVAGVGLVVAIIVSRLDGFQASRAGIAFHPPNTDTSHKVPALQLADGFETPTGLAVAANGDLAIVELNPAAVSVYSVAGAQLSLEQKLPLPVPPGGQAFHVVFHPDYPAQPYLYVTAEQAGPEGKLLQVLRVHIAGQQSAAESLITGLPIGQSEVSNHFGGGIAVCGGKLFVSTADTEPNVLHDLPLGTPGVYRQMVQDPLTGLGKVMRWRFDGPDVLPDGVLKGDFPEYALGFRNPFSMACDPISGSPVVADNGPGDGHDQVRIVAPGTNHGWPISSLRHEFSPPLFDTQSAHIAPTGIAVRREGSGYQYLVTGYLSQSLDSLTVDANGRLTGKYRLLVDVPGGAYAVAADDAGCVYFTSASALFRMEDGRCH